MKRELSSKTTVLVKLILPAVFVLMTAATIIGGFIAMLKGEFPLSVLLMFFVMLIGGAAAFYFTTGKYKKVSVDDRFLYVSNFLKEIKIPLSEIGDITEIKWVRGHPVTIHLRNESEFGRKITFTPKLRGLRFFSSDPVVEELKEMAGIKYL